MTTVTDSAIHADLGRPLNAEEMQVLNAVAAGRTASVIAKDLGMSPTRVTKCMTRIRRLLGATNAPNAIHLAHERGLLGEGHAS